MQERLMQLLEDVLEETDLDRSANPIEDLGMDSVDLIDYVLRVEEEFGCDIEEFDALSQHMQSVDDMIGYLVFLLKDKGSKNG